MYTKIAKLTLSHERGGAVVEGIHLLHALTVRIRAHVKLSAPVAALEETHSVVQRAKSNGETKDTAISKGGSAYFVAAFRTLLCDAPATIFPLFGHFPEPQQPVCRPNSFGHLTGFLGWEGRIIPPTPRATFRESHIGRAGTAIDRRCCSATFGLCLAARRGAFSEACCSERRQAAMTTPRQNETDECQVL